MKENNPDMPAICPMCGNDKVELVRTFERLPDSFSFFRAMCTGEPISISVIGIFRCSICSISFQRKTGSREETL